MPFYPESMRSWFKYLWLFAFVFYTEGCSLIQHEEPSTDTLESFNIMPAEEIYRDLDAARVKRKWRQVDSVFKNLERLTGFNGVVLYAEKGRIIYHKAFGYADPVKRRQPLELNSLFELASVSKMFTAAAIMQLAENEKISFDKDIRAWIPEWPYEGITVRQLLTHRSGLPRYEFLADEHWPDKSVPLTNERMIGLFVEHRPAPYFKPDNGFHYCNTNYALLASLIERISGLTFDQYMSRYVFEPAGMFNSVIYRLPSVERVQGFVELGVPGYDQRGKRLVRVPNDYLNGVVGDKIMFSTVEDLYKFEVALNSGRLLSETSLLQAYAPGSPWHRGRRDNYGFGWRIKSDMQQAVYHYGWWKGFRTFFLRDLENHKTLIVLTNKSKGPGTDHLWNLLKDNRITFSEASVNAGLLLRKPKLRGSSKEIKQTKDD